MKFFNGTRKSNQFRYCSRNVKKFFSETTLHGLKYLVDDELTIIEKLYFLIALVISIFVSYTFAAEIFIKWQNTPVIIGRNSYATPIDSIPFPALTICNMNQIQRSNAEAIKPGTHDYVYLQRACFTDFNYSSYTEMKQRRRNDTFSNFIVSNSQFCTKMIVHCKFGSEVIRCSNLFREVIMDEGLCCAFNMLHPFYAYKRPYGLSRDHVTATYSGHIPVDWSPEKGYQKDLPTDYYPIKAKGAGASLGLSIILNAEIDEYYCSSTNGAGFKINLNNPIDTPQIRETGLPVMIGRQSRFRIDSTSFEALPTIRSINPRLRRCYFNDEKELLYYKYYTRRNCEAECLSKFILRRCNCIPHHMPKIYSNASECNIKHFDCLSATELILEDDDKSQCKKECLASCFDISYLPKVFVTPFATLEYNMREPYFHNLSKTYIHQNLAQAQFYYKEFFFHSRVRTPYTGFTEFLSQTGGILSFLTGFSVVSIAEISYYTIWRPIFEVIARLRQKRRVHAVQPFESVMETVQKTNEFIMCERGEMVGNIEIEMHTFKKTPQSTGLIMRDRALVKRKLRRRLTMERH